MQWHFADLGKRCPIRRLPCLLLSRQLDYRESYHWHNAMSLAIRFFPRAFATAFCMEPGLFGESLRILPITP
jgi:hypothetical protein